MQTRSFLPEQTHFLTCKSAHSLLSGARKDSCMHEVLEASCSCLDLGGFLAQARNPFLTSELLGSDCQQVEAAGARCEPSLGPPKET